MAQESFTLEYSSPVFKFHMSCSLVMYLGKLFEFQFPYLKNLDSNIHSFIQQTFIYTYSELVGILL